MPPLTPVVIELKEANASKKTTDGDKDCLIILRIVFILCSPLVPESDTTTICWNNEISNDWILTWKCDEEREEGTEKVANLCPLDVRFKVATNSGQTSDDYPT